MFKNLQGTAVGGWTIRKLVDSGKSAVVFVATKKAHRAALKVFDPELVERYGFQTQLSRIRLELSLKGAQHPNLVEIYDGGHCPNSGYLFVAMEFMHGTPLSKLLPTIPRDDISTIVSQIASAARFLEDAKLAHRDIKPSNIVYDPTTQQATLLDLGVLRPIDSPEADLPGDTGDDFVGTLQYSPPEFLLREEEDSPEGWRSITFYQIGAVLHDLIQRYPIFDGISPYAKMVNAVQDQRPEFTASDVNVAIINLAANCLTKDPVLRSELVKWSNFHPNSARRNAVSAARRRVAARQTNNTRDPQHHTVDRTPADLLRKKALWFADLLRQYCVANSDILPPVQIYDDGVDHSLHIVQAYFRPDLSRHIPIHLRIYFEIIMLDVASIAFDLRTSAIIAQIAAEKMPKKTTRLAAGALDEAIVLDAVEGTLIPILDWVQAGNDQPGVVDLPATCQLRDGTGNE